MPDLAVATDAVLMIICMFESPHRLGYQLSMTAQAVLLQDLAVGGTYFYRFVKILECEFARVVESILGFDHVPPRKRSRQMAVVAHCDSVVAPLLPAVKLLAHDMTVDADIWVVRKIGTPLGIIESIEPDPEKYSGERHYRQRPFGNHRGLLALCCAITFPIAVRSILSFVAILISPY